MYEVHVGLGFGCELFIIIFGTICWLFTPVSNESVQKSKVNLEKIEQVVSTLNWGQLRRLASSLKIYQKQGRKTLSKAKTKQLILETEPGELKEALTNLKLLNN